MTSPGFQVTDPSTGEVVEIFETATDEQIEAALAASAAAYASWKDVPITERAAIVAKDAVDKGATLHAGGVLSDGPAAYYTPAVLTGVTKEMRAYSEELFGPVAVVYKVSSDEEAVELANDTPYGLGGLVFSKDQARAEKVAERLDVGMANVNWLGEGPQLPFGGTKRSGFGRELGAHGMDEFVNKRMFFIAG